MGNRPKNQYQKMHAYYKEKQRIAHEKKHVQKKRIQLFLLIVVGMTVLGMHGYSVQEKLIPVGTKQVR